MADVKISALTDIVALAAADEIPVADASDLSVTKSATMTEVATYLQTLGMPVVVRLNSQYTNATTTGTSVTGLKFASLVAGTYYVRWLLFVQSTLTTTSWKFGVNYTGTVTKMCNYFKYPSAGVTAATGVMIDTGTVTTGRVFSFINSTAVSTTAPNMGPLTDTTAANVNHLCEVESLIVVSNGGDLELWAASETTAQMSVEIGSSGILIRTA